MRKLIVWVLVALLALSGCAIAEGTAIAGAINGADAVNTGTDLYFAIPDGSGQMLLRIPVAGGTPTCMDRGDHIEDLIPYEGGVAYLKAENGSSAIVACDGNNVSTVYALGAGSASALSMQGGKMLVLIDGLLHSIEPATQLRLRLSGTEMLDYVLDDTYAYFLSAGDRMEYTATLENGGTATAQAGCIYSLNLNTGETTLLLKSGGEDLKIAGNQLYFHNLADAYAVRTTDSAQLLGRVYALDVQSRSGETQCTDPDSGFWPVDRGLVVWSNGALNLDAGANTLNLYSPQNGATVVSDGSSLYVWESSKQTLTRIQTNGTQTTLYTGDLTQAAEPTQTAAASAQNDVMNINQTDEAALFQAYANDQPLTGVTSQATPIGTLPTPIPSTTTTADNGTANIRSSGSNSYSTYSVNISNLEITGRSVNVRTGPGTGYSTMGSVTRGTVVQSTGRAAKDSGGNTWYQIKYGGSNGWVFGSYAKSTSSSSSSSSASGTVYTNGSVNLRSGPGLSYSSKGTVPKGVALNVTRKSTDSRGVVWFKTSYNGKSGWVSSRYLQRSKPSGGGSSSASGTVYTNGSVNLRSGPGLGYSSKGTVPKGVALKVTQKSTDSRGVVWFKTSYNGKSGWVSSRYLQTSKPSGGGSSSGGSSGFVRATGDVTIRSGPGLSYAKRGYMKSGNYAVYLDDASRDSRGVLWYKVYYNGVTGWVSSRYATR